MEDNMFSQILDTLKNNRHDDSPLVNSFYAAHELNPESLSIEVEGIGKINFPLEGTADISLYYLTNCFFV